MLQQIGGIAILGIRWVIGLALILFGSLFMLGFILGPLTVGFGGLLWLIAGIITIPYRVSQNKVFAFFDSIGRPAKIVIVLILIFSGFWIIGSSDLSEESDLQASELQNTTEKVNQTNATNTTNAINTNFSSSNFPHYNLCGNGIVDHNETCETCPEDVKCLNGTICCDGVCVYPKCKDNSECDDNDPLTEDRCINEGSCNAECEHKVKDVVKVKFGSNITVHGLFFYANVLDEGETVWYISKSDENETISAHEGNKLIEIEMEVRAVDEDNGGFFVSSIELMDEHGNIYEPVCPIDSIFLKNCDQKYQLKSVYPFLRGQRVYGVLFFEVPEDVQVYYLIYKFSTWAKPKAIEFSNQ